MKPIVIFGTGGLGELVHYYLHHDSQRKVAAFTADREYIKETTFCGLPIVPFDEVERHFPPQTHDMIVCIGYRKLTHYATITATRKARFQTALDKGYALPGYISSRTHSWPNVPIGRNAILIEQNTFHPFVSIGDNVLFYGHNIIGHHSSVGNHCFVTGGVVVSGNAHIGDGTFVGVHTSVANEVIIGKDCLIGSGSIISQSLPDFSVYTPGQSGLKRIPSHKLTAKKK